MGKNNANKILKKNKAKFVNPTQEEIINDRKDFLNSEMVKVVNAADECRKLKLGLERLEAIITFRKVQIQKEIIEESFEGALKPMSLLKADLNINIYNFNNNLRIYTKNLEFLEKEKFTKKDLNEVIAGTFDFKEWRNKKEKEITDNIKITEKGIKEVKTELETESKTKTSKVKK